MTPDILELLKQGGAVGVLGLVLYYGLRFGANQHERVINAQVEALKEFGLSQKALISTQEKIGERLHEHALNEERQHGETLVAMERQHTETRARIAQLSCYERKDDAA